MFDDERIFELDTAEQATEDNPAQYKCELVPGPYTQRGRLYCVLYDGQPLIDGSYDPEFDACRALLRHGITGKLTTYRDGKASMVLDISKAAQAMTRDNRYGTPVFVKYRQGH